MAKVPVEFTFKLDGQSDVFVDRIHVTQDQAKRLPASRLFEIARQAGKLQGYQHDGKKWAVFDGHTGDVSRIDIYLLKYDPADSGFVEPK